MGALIKFKCSLSHKKNLAKLFEYKMIHYMYAVQKDGSQYTLEINGVYYQINAILYHILKGIKKGDSLTSIALSLEKNHQIKATTKEIEELITLKVNPLFEKRKKDTNHLKTGFWISKDLFSYSQYKFIALPLKHLFIPKIFWASFLLLVGCNFYQLFELQSPLNEFNSCYTSFSASLLTYILLIIIILFHEIGHASSAMAFGKKPHHIGFGFYSVFPVFYAEVTTIWTLSKSKRLIINLAGIYFQALIGTVLIVMVKIIDQNHFPFLYELLFNLVVCNVLLIFVNLIPFFKFDGYWCYSDYFNLPNLSYQSKIVTRMSLKKHLKIPFYVSKKQAGSVNQKSIALIIFTILKNSVMVGFSIVILRALYKLVRLIVTTSWNFDFLSWCWLLTHSFKIVLSLILLWYLIKMTKKTIANLKTYFT